MSSIVIGAPSVAASAFATANRSLITSVPVTESARIGRHLLGQRRRDRVDADQLKPDGTTRRATPADRASASSGCPTRPSWRSTRAAGRAATSWSASAESALTPTARTRSRGIERRQRPSGRRTRRHGTRRQARKVRPATVTSSGPSRAASSWTNGTLPPASAGHDASRPVRRPSSGRFQHLGSARRLASERPPKAVACLVRCHQDLAGTAPLRSSHVECWDR